MTTADPLLPQDDAWGEWPVGDVQDTAPSPAPGPPADGAARLTDPPGVVAAQARAWRRRPSPRLLKLVAWLVVTVCFVVATNVGSADEPAELTAEIVTSRAWLLGAAAFGLMLAAILTLPFALRAGLWLTVAAGLTALASGDSTLTASASILTIAAVSIAGGDVLAARHQRRAARRWPSAEVPVVSGPLTPFVRVDQRRRLLAPSVAVTVWGGIILAGGLVAGLWYAADAAATASFRAGADTAVAVVTSNDDWAAYVTIGGVDLRVVEWWATHPVGESAAVRYDLQTGRAEFVDDAFDLSLTLFFASLTLGLAAALWGVYLARRRRLTLLLRRGGPALAVHAEHAQQDEDRVELATIDADRADRWADGGSFAGLVRPHVLAVPADNSLSRRLATLLSTDDEPPPTPVDPLQEGRDAAPPPWRATRARPAVVVGLGSEDDPVLVLLTPTAWAVGRAGVRA